MKMGHYVPFFFSSPIKHFIGDEKRFDIIYEKK